MFDIFQVLTPEMVLFVFIGAVAGLFVGAIPGLSVSMATALLVSITYTWETSNALATIMGVFVVGVYSGAVSAILINIPGAPSSVVTTLDGYPLAKKGQAYKALYYATVYSFIGSVIGLLVLWVLAKPISSIALKFTPMDYFLLSFFGLATVGSLTSKNFSKGLISAVLGVVLSMIGVDQLMGTPRLTFGSLQLKGGIGTVPALVGLFGFSEVLSVVFSGNYNQIVLQAKKVKVKISEVLSHWRLVISSSAIGVFVGALPGAGGPVAAFLAYNVAKKQVKNPETPFGEGALEGIVASETSNNACIGGALIPMLTLAVPGDAVTAILLSVFYVHGLKPGPTFIAENPEGFATIVVGGFIGCVALLLLGLTIAPRLGRILNVPKRILIPVVTILCVIGAFACNNRIFDVVLMIAFGVLGFVMRRRGYQTAPMVLGLVLGSMMDSNFRRAISLASTSDSLLAGLFGRPITMVLLICILITLGSNIPFFKRIFSIGKSKAES